MIFMINYRSIRAAIAAGALALAATGSFAQAAKQPDTADPALGEPLYQANCASCHGANLEGQENWQSANDDGTLPAPPHDESGHTWHHGDDLLFNYTRLGGQAALERMGVTGFNSAMPAFGEQLTDAEIWDILAFIKSNWRPRILEVQATRTEAEQLRGN